MESGIMKEQICMMFLPPDQMLRKLQGKHNPGLYYIRAKTENVIRSLSDQLYNEYIERLSIYIDSPDPLVIYIGKANGARGIHQRLQQDLLHTGPSTFFRGVGAVMGKNPIRATTQSGVRNFRFNVDDTNEIIDFMQDNFEIMVEEQSQNHPAEILSTEKDKIMKYKPIFNKTHNTHPSAVIMNNRSRCRTYAAEFMHLTEGLA